MPGSGSEVIRVSLALPAPALERAGNWTRLAYPPGEVEPCSPEGRPEVYAVRKLVALPPGAAVLSVSMLRHERAVTLARPLVPALTPTLIGQPLPEPVPDPIAYRSRELYPEQEFTWQAVRVGSCDLLELTVYPARYQARTRRLVLCDAAQVEVAIVNPYLPATTTPRNEVDRGLARRVVNPGDLAFPVPPAPTRAARLGSLATGASADYLVISPAAWTSDVSIYTAAKTAQGITTKVFSVESIYANYSGADNPERILNFIRDCSTNWPAVSYVLLVGDTNAVPTHMIDGYECDVYYSLLQTNSDTQPDLYVGRLPAISGNEAKAILAKWSAYNCRGWGRSQVNLTGEEDALFGANNTLGNYGWSTVSMLGSNVFVTLTTNDVLNALGAVNGLITWVGHGAPESWAINIKHLPADTNALFYRDNHALTRTQTNLPFVNAMLSCYAGQFLDSTQYIAPAFIRAPAGGAIGYIGGNKLVYRADAFVKDRFESRMLDSYLRTGYAYPARFFYESIAGDRNIMRLFNLLGDPTAVMDLRPATDDTDPPHVSFITITPTQVLAGASVTNVSMLFDADQVGIVEQIIIRPDGSAHTNEMPYLAGTMTHRCTNSGYATAQTGLYQVLVRAWDISRNSVLGTGENFIVTADTTPPGFSEMTIAPTQGFEGIRITISAQATDNAAVASINAVIVNGGVTNILALPKNDGYTNEFVDTFNPGLHTVSVIATDFSGLSSQTTGTFRILADDEAPVIQNAWCSELPPGMDGDYERLFHSNACPVTPFFTVVALDNVTAPLEMDAWLYVEGPSGTITSNDPSGIGMWTGAFSGGYELTEVGSHRVVFKVTDIAHNTAWSEPYFFHVLTNGLPTPAIIERELGTTQGVLSVLGIPGAAPFLLACSNLTDHAWYEVEPADAAYTNGYYIMRFPIPPHETRQYYRGSTNAP